jgi:hypothetical protein
MDKMKRLILYSLICALSVFAVTVLAQEEETEVPFTQPTYSELTSAWTIIPTDGTTTCARDTQFQFFARRGTSNNLMIYFQGGGACWSPLTCMEGGTFDPSVTDDEFDHYDGIFNLQHPDNPLANYNMVFIPYCTADIHIGDQTVNYWDGIDIAHNGYNNSVAVLDWVYQNFPNPTSILTTGSSAGAYGAIYHAADIITQYPNARHTVLGDAGIGATPEGWSILETSWNIYENLSPNIPAWETVDQSTFTADLLYKNSAEAFPNVRFAQFTHYGDEVQMTFYRFGALGKTDQDWLDILYQSFETLNELENFTSYVAPGRDHTILAYPEFYTLTSNEVRFYDWFVQLLTGNEKPESVFCDDCGFIPESTQ